MAADHYGPLRPARAAGAEKQLKLRRDHFRDPHRHDHAGEQKKDAEDRILGRDGAGSRPDDHDQSDPARYAHQDRRKDRRDRAAEGLSAEAYLHLEPADV